ncbi:MAG: FAD-dependent oxidoreductase [Polyangiales bacterium]
MTHPDPARRVLVVGGGYAGVLAANRLAHALPADHALTLLTEGDALLDRVRLHECVARGRPPEVPYARSLHPRVRRLRERATALRAGDRVVETASAALPYDALLLALGSRLSSPVPGVAEHASALRDARSARAAFETLRALPEGAPVVVLGGSLTALEVAAEIAEAHPTLRVTLAARRFAPTLSPRGAALARSALADLGVIVRDPTTCVAVEPDLVRFDDGASLPAALAVWAGGFDPAGLSRDSELSTDRAGRVRVRDDLQAVGVDGVFVAGDLAAPTASLPFLRMGCASAMPMGAAAADNLARWLRAEPTRAHRFAYWMQCVSLGRRAAVIQSVTPDDRPTERVVTGRGAVMVKETVCRFVLGMLRAERALGGAYRWPTRAARP